jgi:hypothetical protein
VREALVHEASDEAKARSQQTNLFSPEVCKESGCLKWRILLSYGSGLTYLRVCSPGVVEGGVDVHYSCQLCGRLSYFLPLVGLNLTLELMILAFVRMGSWYQYGVAELPDSPESASTSPSLNTPMMTMLVDCSSAMLVPPEMTWDNTFPIKQVNLGRLQ